MSSLMQLIESGAKSIQVTHQHFNPNEFSSFARELRDNEIVTLLFLNSNHINDVMVSELAEALCHNRYVKNL